MDTKLKKFSHSIITKIIVFIIVIGCLTGTVTVLFNTIEKQDIDFDNIFEENYYLSSEFMRQSDEIIRDLTYAVQKYKSKEHILQGESIDKNYLKNREENLFYDFKSNSMYFDENLSTEENYEKFKEVYKDELSQNKNNIIQKELREYENLIEKLKDYDGIIYYASNGDNVISNTSNLTKKDFKMFPSYMVFDKDEELVYPKEIKDNKNYSWIISYNNGLNQLDRFESTIYVAFTEDYLNSNIKEWKEKKVIFTNGLYKLAGFLLCLILAFVYLVLVIGRKHFKDKELNFNVIDKLYNDINVFSIFMLTVLWIIFIDNFYYSSRSNNAYLIIIPITVILSSLCLLLVLSLIKHIKNRSLFKHTLIYTIIYKIIYFIRDVYDNGSIAVKIVLITIGYPVILMVTFFMFPITIGVAAWLALRKAKEFNSIKEGVERIKDGDINYSISTSGKGEFGRLANNINGIGEGLKEAVNNELKSERLKTELITNVSHDIRTPLTSIITYVDLLKQEKDKSKTEEYIKVLEQKSQRLKVLTDDLFQAAKASSGSIPVSLEKINIVSLVTQGLGELDDKIQELELEFKMNYTRDKMYIKADGKLLWRGIENLLSNIFKYALKGSRVYIDIEDLGNDVNITFKNISAYELNISADELMERFKRGDESRSSQGSGLGLSIAKSLIDVQNGNFNIQVDGDLFKAIIKMPKTRD
ncbi:HAMP domain-containing sensor histidine kinase [Clostridium sediminicola]|uniref:HAMP domain-containing sensor histidine kinase n=1 Tax=Clostridium sediminicola TaxID=3114879 RepID=UPI0031F23E6E